MDIPRAAATVSIHLNAGQYAAEMNFTPLEDIPFGPRVTTEMGGGKKKTTKKKKKRKKNQCRSSLTFDG